MSKRTKQDNLMLWRVARIAAKGQDLGQYKAAGAEDAIEKAVAFWNLDDAAKKRLIAYPVER